MTRPTSTSQRVGTVLRRLATILYCAGLVITLALGQPKICHEESVNAQLVTLCRGPQLADPVVIVALVLAVLLLGFTITEVTIGGTKVVLNAPSHSLESSSQSLSPLPESIHQHSVELALLVAGVARTFPSDDAFLLILFKLREGRLVTVEKASSRASEEDPRLDAIADSLAVRTLASQVIDSARPLTDWITPFPEVNSLVRKCVGAPVRRQNGSSAAIVAIALDDGRRQSSASDIAILAHLQAATSALSGAMEPSREATSYKAGAND